MLGRESVFHDEWAKNTSLSDVLVQESFEAGTAPENRFILKKMGDLKGKQVLDLGCGLGEAAVYFALQGAKVTAVDLSPEMVRLTRKLASHYGVTVNAITSSAESLNVPENAFDFVYIGNLLHHVEDRDRCFFLVWKALKRAGKFFSWDPLAYNPAINIYRRVADKVRTTDERPLTLRDIAIAKRHFSNVGHREFWLCSLLLFFKYYLFDRVNPNQERYWKKILRDPAATAPWFVLLQKMDSIFTRIPGIRWLSWNTVLWGTKE